MWLPANPTARRAEEAHRIRARLAAMDGQIEAMAKLMEVGAQAPSFTDADVEEVGKLLVEGRLRLPRYCTFTVTTEIEEIKDKVFGNSTVYNHTADYLCCNRLQPTSIGAAIEAGLLVRLGSSQGRESNWIWNEAAYRRLVPPDPRLVQ
jgi:hypothetical protein